MRIQPARIVFPPEDRAEVAAAITETLTTGALTLGPWTKQFEAAFAAAHQTPNAIAVASGTCALEIILRATGVAGGDVRLFGPGRLTRAFPTWFDTTFFDTGLRNGEARRAREGALVS